MKKHLKKIILSVSALIVLVIGGMVINHQMKISDMNEKLSVALAKDYGITESILKIEGETTNATYQDLFDMCDKAVKDRSELLVELRGLYPNLESELRDSLINLINLENDITRSKEHAYRAKLSTSSLERLYDLRSTYLSSYYFSDSYHRAMVNEAYDLIDDVVKGRDAIKDFTTIYGKLVKIETRIAVLMDDEDLLFKPFYTKNKDSNIKVMTDLDEIFVVIYRAVKQISGVKYK
jgi:hypothetical protein